MGPQPETEGKEPVVSICNNGGVHRFPPVTPVVTIDSVASVVSASGVHNTPPGVALRVRHDAGALGLLGNCIQSSSQVRYRQGWACWVDFILLYCGTSDFHTLFPEGAVLQSVAMALVHYLYTDEQRTSQFIDQTLSHVRHYYKIHGRCSDALLSPAVSGVKRAVRIECATLTERIRTQDESFLSRGICWHRLSSTTVQGSPWGITSSRWLFGVDSATCFGLPSTSTHRAVGCFVTVYWRST